MKRRMGRFYVNIKDVFGMTQDSNIFRMLDFIPIYMQFLGHKNVIEYIGKSPKFEEIEDNVAEPEYKINIKMENGKMLLDSVEKVKC